MQTELTSSTYSLAVTVLHLRLQFSSQDFGVSVDRRHETEAHGSTDSLCDFALVDRSKTSLVTVLDTAKGGDIFGHDGKVLINQSVSG